MTKQLLYYNQQAHENFKINTVRYIVDILHDIKKELENQKVDTSKFTLEYLAQNKPSEIFKAFYTAKRNKADKDFDYDSYLSNFNVNDKKLKELEELYTNLVNKTHKFYPINNDFYLTCDALYARNSKMEKALIKAPSKKVYSIDDFLKIRGNDYTIDVPKELYILYATNKNQLETIKNIDNYITACRNLNLDYKTAMAPVKEFVNSMDQDLKSYELNYNEILTIV
ncbi:hypothetical protein SAMN04489722_1031 [Algibacter lectus]|uniref:hypothetical protein n=1 Tax=Algibacter lectus TaxID=221126 RepID=UPI0008E5D9F6|nr:hypothetical protein [Algibacter lectus]SFC61699.1 hypothetical protein SAMN04489722_1031 [Algibacter lectus]